MSVIKKIKQIFTKDVQPMTNGNKFDVYKKMEIQEQIDKRTLSQLDNQMRNSISDAYSFGSAIRTMGKSKIQEKNIEPYFLLQYQADYFCNTCKFECEDLHIRKMVIDVIRGAFFLGTAGIYWNEQSQEFEPVYINQMDYSIDGKLRSCKTLPLKLCISKMNEFQRDISSELVGFRELNQKQCENLAVFSWGTMGYSAWIRIWPFVQLQHQLLTMIIIHAYVFNKKWEYRINNPSAITQEIELFFDSYNPFIVNFGNGEDIANRFVVEDVSNTNQVQPLLDYYEKTIAIYYSIIGRQVNLDVKKERNVSDEVQASQENFDVVQSEYLNQFAMFIEKLNELGANIKVQEKEVEHESNQDNNNGFDNQSNNNQSNR